MLAYFNRFTIQLTKSQAESCSHSGDCDCDVEELLKNKAIQRQLSCISAEDIAAELKEYGAWDFEELSDSDANKRRILWIAAGNITEELKNG
jgi:hypothetical protein